MASYQWIKLYDEILDDPKMGRLSDGAYRFCINLFLLAGRQEERDGSLPDAPDIAWTLRLSDELVNDYIGELAKSGIITRSDEGISITNFQKRQGPIDSTERSRMSRERNKPDKPRNDSLQQSQRTRDTWATKLWRPVPASSGIYKITCSGAGLVYIGASVNMQSRIRAHLSEMSSTPHHTMSSDFAEYGNDSIDVSVLEECTEEKLREREQYWIDQHPADGTYNTQNFSKRHRDWPEQLDDATIRCIDIDIDIDKKKKERRKEKYIHTEITPDPVNEMINALSKASGVTFAVGVNDSDFRESAYALIGNDITPDDLPTFCTWWATNGHYKGKPALKSILTKIKGAKDSGWADLPKTSANGNGAHKRPEVYDPTMPKPGEGGAW